MRYTLISETGDLKTVEENRGNKLYKSSGNKQCLKVMEYKLMKINFNEIASKHLNTKKFARYIVHNINKRH